MAWDPDHYVQVSIYGDFLLWRKGKVRNGNLLWLWSVRLFTLCIHQFIPVVLEKPLSSMAWDMPPMQKLIRQCILSGVQFGVLSVQRTLEETSFFAVSWH